MAKEFNLSEEIYSIDPWEYDSTKTKMDMESEVINKKKVKEFIKKLKAKLFEEAIERKLPLTASSLDSLPCNWVNRIINKLAGDKLF